MSVPVQVFGVSDDQARVPEIANSDHILANDNTDALPKASCTEEHIQDEGNLTVEVAGDSLIRTVGSDSLGEKPLLPQDVGWHQDLNDLPAHLIEGVSNETLWMLIRRFNKVRSTL